MMSCERSRCFSTVLSFDDAKTVQKLKLQRAESTPSGGLLLDYEVPRA